MARHRDPETALIVCMVEALDAASEQMRARVLGYLCNRYETSFTITLTKPRSDLVAAAPGATDLKADSA